MSSDAVASKNKTDVISKVDMSKNNETVKKNTHRVTKTIVTSPNIYKPVGPYSQAILADKTLYVSGVLGMDAQAQLVCGGAEAQTKQALENLKHILEAGGASLESVVKTTILLNNLNDFQVVNQVYAEYKSIQFEEDSDETYSKHIDKESENRTEMKGLPPSDTTEPVQIISNNKSTISLIPEKDLNTIGGHIVENQLSDINKTTKEYEENDEKISKLQLEVLVKFIGDKTTQDTNIDIDFIHTDIDKTTEITTKAQDEAEATTENKIDSNLEQHSNNSAEASPTQSQSSRATRWEALADIAAELPPSLAVDPITGQIYSLSK